MVGHDAPRELRRKYLREWRKRNPEKVRQYNRDYWIRRAKKALQEQEDAVGNDR